MKHKSLILIAIFALLGVGQPALAEHAGQHHRTVSHHSGHGHYVKQRFHRSGHHRKHFRSHRYRAPRYIQHHYYRTPRYGHGHRYYRHHHRVNPLVAGVVLGSLVYALHDH